MKSTASKVTWGILFVLLGIALAGRALGILSFNMFFNGWWTLFIIIPCALGLSERGHRTSSMIGLGVGILLLLSAQGVLQWYMFGRVLVAFIFIIIGCSIMLRGNQDRRYSDRSDSQYTNNQNGDQSNYNYDGNPDYGDAGNKEGYNYDNTYNDGSYSNDNHMNNNFDGNNFDGNNFDGNSYDGNSYGGPNYDNRNNYQSNYGSNYNSSTSGRTNHDRYNHFTGLLSGRTVQFVDEVFTGAVVTSILGSVQLDLRNAIFNGNAAIETTCILGGVDIYVPANVKVVNNCSAILAGVDNDVISPYSPSGELYTLFINGTCILGGIEVK
jgi:predicted membrane protein